MHSNLIPLHEFKESLFLLRSHEGISHNNNTHVLHSVDSEFRDKYHIVFFEREGTRKVVFKKFDCNFNSAEPLLRLCQLSLSFSAVNLHWNFEPSFIGDAAVWTNCQSIDVSANGRASIELVQMTCLPKVYLVE